jgi:hypothetical protein
VAHIVSVSVSGVTFAKQRLGRMATAEKFFRVSFALLSVQKQRSYRVSSSQKLLYFIQNETYGTTASSHTPTV